MARNQSESLERNIGFLLHDTSRLMRKSFDRRVASLGITRSQWQVLAFVYRDQGLTQSALAEVMDVGKVTLGGLLDRLEAKGWIERHPDGDDRRIKRVFTAPGADQVLAAMRGPAMDLYAQAFDGFSERQRDTLIDALLKLKENLAVVGKSGETMERSGANQQASVGSGIRSG